MVNIDALLSEWAYRCEKGYPDMDSPSDLRVLKTILKEQGISLPEFQEQVITEQEEKKKKVTASDIAKLVQDMEKDGVLKDKHLTFLNQYLTSRPFKDTVDNFLKTKNIDGDTLSKDETPAQDQLFKILQDEGQVEEFTNYMKDPINLSDLPKTGNLFDEVKKASGLKDSTIQRILHLKGTEGGRGVGKAELFLSMFFGDVKMRIVGKGDLTWNNKYLEVKGSAARLGKRAVAWLGYKNSILGKLADEYDKSDKALPSLIANLADEVDPPTDLPKLRDGIKEFAKEAYSSSDLIDKLVDGLSDEDLKNENKIRKVLTTLYYDSYAKSENVEEFIFVNTAMRTLKDKTKTFGRYNSRYRLFGADEIENLINTNQMTLSGTIATDDLYPSLNTI